MAHHHTTLLLVNHLTLATLLILNNILQVPLLIPQIPLHPTHQVHHHLAILVKIHNHTPLKNQLKPTLPKQGGTPHKEYPQGTPNKGATPLKELPQGIPNKGGTPLKGLPQGTPLKEQLLDVPLKVWPTIPMLLAMLQLQS